jgi:hypothetical protein
VVEPRNGLERRQFLLLREELDGFIDLVRKLNQEVVDGSWDETAGTKASMVQALDYIAATAGQAH